MFYHVSSSINNYIVLYKNSIVYQSYCLTESLDVTANCNFNVAITRQLC